VDTDNLNPQLGLHLPHHDADRHRRLTEHELPKTTPPRRDATPVAPPSPDQKVKVFTQEGHAAHAKGRRPFDGRF
jgi:hypothetical protein